MEPFDIAGLNKMLAGHEKFRVEKVIHSFKVLHEGWEMDNDAWVVTCDDGQNRIVSTNHGSASIDRIEFFKEKLLHYQDVIEGTKEALILVGELPKETKW